MSIPFALLLTLVPINSAFATDYKSDSALRAFIEKRNACLLAVGVDRSDLKDTLAKPLGLSAADKLIATPVACVQDLTFGKGTIDEATGCAFTNYDPGTDNYTLYSDATYYAGPSMVKKSCASGGFEELMAKKSPDGRTYKAVAAGATTNAKFLLVYSAPTYKKWWQDAHGATERERIVEEKKAKETAEARRLAKLKKSAEAVMPTGTILPAEIKPSKPSMPFALPDKVDDIWMTKAPLDSCIQTSVELKGWKSCESKDFGDPVAATMFLCKSTNEYLIIAGSKENCMTVLQSLRKPAAQVEQEKAEKEERTRVEAEWKRQMQEEAEEAKQQPPDDD
ncbi:MAG: hypothetical protein AB7G93_16455 [Bdellovibrionales bacterium]